MLKKAKNLIIIFVVLTAMSVAVNFALAQSADSLLWGGTQNEVGNVIGLGSEDPRVLAANIIRVALGFLGIIALVLTIYAGWLWMSAAGNMEKIEKAKKVLTGAIIGLLIILLSFGITTFVLNKLLVATGGACDNGVVKTCGCADLGTQTCVSESWTDCNYTCSTGEACCAFGCADSCDSPPEFHINSTSPQNGDTNVIRNIKIRYTSNLFIGNTNPVNAVNFTVADESGDQISGVRKVDGKRIIFTPDGDCGSNPCGATDCFKAGEKVTVAAVNGASGILSVGDIQLACPGIGVDCAITFNVGDLIDCEDPTVNLGLGQICAVPDNNLFASSADDNGVDSIAFSADGVSVGSVVNSDGDSPFSANVLWDGSGYTAGDSVAFTATAYDIDSRSASDNETIKIKSAHCCNGVQDIADGEEGVDCGGECGACAGSACAIDAENLPATSCSDDLCASGFCSSSGSNSDSCSANGYNSGVSDCCLCQNAPIIDWVAPTGGFCDDSNNTPCQKDSDCSTTCDISAPNGANGNLATIGGRYFGAEQGAGSVVFNDGVNTFTADLADTVNINCTNSWQDGQIIVVVPAGLNLGPGTTITVTADNGFSDNTQSADGRGPDFDFIVNTIKRPGLCLINPDAGVMNDSITYYGIGLNGATAKFGSAVNNVNALNSVFSGDTQGTADVPNMQTGKTTSFTAIKQDNININSNFLRFIKNSEPKIGPKITSFNPIEGKAGQYVTIYGSGFGYAKKAQIGATHHVYFDDNLSDSIDGVEADYNFPDICGDSLWSDNQIIVKAPAGLVNLTDYYIVINVQNWDKPIDSSGIIPTATANDTFKYDESASLKPSLCRIQPVIGPNNSDISLWGEYFGAQAAGLVRFNLNKDQSGSAISYWGDDNDAKRIDTTVHNDAVSGPVVVVRGGDKGNGINFTVGSCAEQDNPDDACGTQICCPAGTYEEGRCEATADDCYMNVSSSVYEWDFSTGGSGGAGDSCDLDRGTSLCEDNGSCGQGLICDTSTCTCQLPTTCSGYNLNQCQDTEFCPNSPGQCSPNAGGETVDMGGCSDADCNGVGACVAPPCSYSVDLNKCVDNTQGDCSLDSTTQDVFGKNIAKYCSEYNDGANTYAVWHIATGASCPNGWTRIAGDKCVDSITADTCNICDSGFTCLDDNGGGGQGICGIDQDVCSAGSTCNTSSARCETADGASCDCCCEIGQDARDCCTGLVCGGTCGSDTTDDNSGFGSCSGCKIEVNGTADQSLSDAACNCEGTSGKYCELNDTAYPSGVCRDKILDCAPPNELCDDSTCCSTACEGTVGSTFCPATCGPGEEECGTACCSVASGGCLDASANLCANCAPEEYLCDDSECCDVNCEGPAGETYCPTNPKIETVSPDNGAANVCRNALITADFDQKMNIQSFNGNVIMVGNYGDQVCPPGTEYLAINQRGIINRAWRGAKRIIAGILSPILPQARALSDNFCAISGAVSGFQNSDDTTTLTFSPKDLLDAGIKYYAVIKGDRDLNDDNKEGVLNYNGIGMADDWRDINGTDLTISNGGTVDLIDRTLNNKEYYGYVWSFTTMDEQSPNSGICKIDHVNITPDSYLFNTTNDDISENDANSEDSSFDTVNDRDKVFAAWAISADNQKLSKVAGVYEWNWIWSSDNTAIINLDSVNPFSADSYRQLYEVQQGITDGKAVISAMADVSGSAENGEEKYTGKADAWVFICKNPWPPVTTNGLWEPWGDYFVCNDGSGRCPSTANLGDACGNGGTCAQNCTIPEAGCFNVNYEFYYCRDAGSVGTADDLPAILSGSTIIRGSSTAQNLLKEFYFLREDTPDVSGGIGLAAEDLSKTTEGVVKLTWASTGADGYKVYYGGSPGNYSDYVDVGNVLTKDISGLIIGKTYYFAVTAYDNTGAESKYSNEASITPKDTTPPAPPAGLAEDSACEGKISISWDANTDDAVGYKVYYGVLSGQYGDSYDVKGATSASLTGLTDGQTYYIAVTAYDSYNNESVHSNELEIKILPSC